MGWVVHSMGWGAFDGEGGAFDGVGGAFDGVGCIRRGVVGMTDRSVIPSAVLPTYVIPPPNDVIPSGAPTTPVIPSEVEGSTAVGSMQGSARIPPLRFASVGMTWRGGAVGMSPPLCHPERSRGIYRSRYDAGECEDSSTSLRFGRNDMRFCHPDWSTPHPCHPDWSVSGMEGSTAPGSRQEGARIPPLRFASVGMTYVSVIPTGASAEWRDLPQLVRGRGVRGFLHFASLRSE